VNRAARAHRTIHKPTKITASFSVHLEPDGELTRLCVRQLGNEIKLTEPQARSLAHEILRRLPKEPKP